MLPRLQSILWLKYLVLAIPLPNKDEIIHGPARTITAFDQTDLEVRLLSLSSELQVSFGSIVDDDWFAPVWSEY